MSESKLRKIVEYEQFLSLLKEVEQSGLTKVTDLCKYLGISRQKYYRLTAFAGLPKAVLRYLDEFPNVISGDTAQKIVKQIERYAYSEAIVERIVLYYVRDKKITKQQELQSRIIEAFKNPSADASFSHESDSGEIDELARFDQEYLRYSNRFNTENERALHPVLSYFLGHHEYFKVYTKTILHESSQKSIRGKNKWLYPDMVAVNFEHIIYQNEFVLSFIKTFDTIPIKIYSFEIKTSLNFSNYKEHFFQAVSNSSWANEGYLVAVNVDHDVKFLEALKKLSQSFGIGIIELDLDNVYQSSILSPARYREKLDYSVMNELAETNPTFEQFLEIISDFSSKRKSLEKCKILFDKTFSENEMIDYLLHTFAENNKET